MKKTIKPLLISISLSLILQSNIHIKAQTKGFETIRIDMDSSIQEWTGFGGALAYYEGWVTAHPSKSEIYHSIFNELSLDILRLRNAYEYDNSMIDKAVEFTNAAESALGKPIDVLVSSWGPPAYLKSNKDRKNGGTLQYSIEQGKVNFDYAGFGHWWNKSLDDYKAHGIYPKYISIQNEPDFTATWESCRFDPTEKINTVDTIAGYNLALDAVFDSISGRDHFPNILGPECVGIGYNKLQNYVNSMDTDKIFGIAHHLYHGMDEDNPWSSEKFTEIGSFKPEIPKFQTEFSGGSWYSLAGQIFKSLSEENVTNYNYWDLVWPNRGLIDIDRPWDRSNWRNAKGYSKTKDFYVFKHYSANIHPGWVRKVTEITNNRALVLGFASPAEDSLAVIVINRSDDHAMYGSVEVPGYVIDTSGVWATSADEDEIWLADVRNQLFELPPKSIASISLVISDNQNPPILLENIGFEPSTNKIEHAGSGSWLNAWVFPEDASNKALFYEILIGKDIAEINQDGLLRSLGTGNGTVKVRVSATDGSEVFSEIEIEIQYSTPVTGITISASSDSIKISGGSLQLNAEVFPENATNDALLWELLAGSDIAEINQQGLLTSKGIGDGTVRVRVSSTDGSGISASLDIKLVNQVLVSQISISTSSSIIDEHQGSLQLSAEVLPENASEPTVEWSIEQDDTLATISQDGKLSASGEGNGTVKVNASATDASGITSFIDVEISGQENSVPLSQVFTFRAWTNNNRIYYNIPESFGISQLKLINSSGRTMLLKEIHGSAEFGQITVADLESGYYIVQIMSTFATFSAPVHYIKQ